MSANAHVVNASEAVITHGNGATAGALTVPMLEVAAASEASDAT
jgi:hypothetical protein